MAKVFISLSEAEQDALVSKLFDIVNDRDPIVGWRDPTPEETGYSDDLGDCEPYPVRGEKADYAEHPLLGLARAIVWYAAGNCFTVDADTLAVVTNANHDIFIDALRAENVAFRIVE